MTDNTEDSLASPLDRLIGAMLDMVASDGWPAVTLDAVALRAGIAASAAYAFCTDRGQLLDAYARRVDVAACKEAEAGSDPAAQYDELLDILMRRFEILQVHRSAVVRLVREVPGDPKTLLQRLPQSQRSFAFLAAAAGYPAKGISGLLFAKALSAVWLATQRDWLRDDTSDLSVTMASLDRNLGRAIDLVDPALRLGGPGPRAEDDAQ
jgi:ubiquinone biosynthesis protein COQ9